MGAGGGGGGGGHVQNNVHTQLTLIKEAIYPVDTGTLVVASQKKEVLFVLYLVCEQEADGLKGLLPSVHIVPEKEVVCIWWEASILKEF